MGRLGLAALVAAAVHASRRPLPPGFALCRGPKQVKYSAAWLASRKLLAALPESFLNTSRLAKPGTMMEAASFLLLEGPPGLPGPRALKTLDLLDFYVEHLSWYERRLLVAGKHLGKDAGRAPVAYGRRVMGARVDRGTAAFTDRRPPPGGVAVMPFYAAGQGQGPSSRSLRASYLNATLASVRATLTRDVVVAVTNRGDLDTALAHGPLLDALYLPDLPDPNKLGAATLIALARLVAAPRGGADPLQRDGWLYDFSGTSRRRWAESSDAGFVGSYRARETGAVPAAWRDAAWVYYTESDQIVRARGAADLLAAAEAADVLVLPHRAVPMPLPEDFPETRLDARERAALLGTPELVDNARWGAAALDRAADSCCFDRAEDACTHKNARPVDELRESTSLLRGDDGGFAIVPGEGNFLKMAFRTCRHTRGRCGGGA